MCKSKDVLPHKYFKIDTATDIGHITIRNIDGENMSFIEIEDTLNKLYTDKKRYKQRVKNILQKYYNKARIEGQRESLPVNVILLNIATELGVDLE